MADIQLKDTGLTKKNLLLLRRICEENPARQKFMEARKKYWQAYRGKINLTPMMDARPKDADFESKENKIFEGIETIVAFQTKNNPRYYYVARNSQHEDIASDMNAFGRYDYENIGMRLTIQEWARAKSICGAQPVKVIWDTSMKEDFGEGQNRVDVVSWDDFFPYPNVHDIKHMPFLFHRTSKPYAQIVNNPHYGAKAEEVLGRQGTRGTFGKAWSWIKQAVAVTEASPTDYEPFDVWECWIRPYANVTIEDEDGEEKRIPKFPRGIIVTIINDEVVWVRENIYRHKRFPFVMMYCYRNRDTADDDDLRGTFYDFMGEVEQAASPQRDVDVATNTILANARMLANPPTEVADAQLEVPYSSHEGRVGEVFHVSQIGAVKIHEIQTTPVHLYNLLEGKKTAVFDSMGITDYMRGTRPTSIKGTTGLAVMSAQEAGFGRTNPKSNLVDQAIMDLGILLLSNNQQFRRQEAYFAIVDEGSKPKRIAWTGEHSVAEFAVQVEHGSTTPANDLDRVAHATQLFQMVLPIIAMPNPPIRALDLVAWYIQTTRLPTAQSLLQLINKIRQEEATMQDLLTMLQQQGAQAPAGEGAVAGTPETPPPVAEQTMPTAASQEAGITGG